MTLLVISARTLYFKKDFERERVEKNRKAFSCRGRTCLILSDTQFWCVTFDHSFIRNCIHDLRLSVAQRHTLVGMDNSRFEWNWFLSVSINFFLQAQALALTRHQARYFWSGRSDLVQDPHCRWASLNKVPEIHNLFTLITSSQM